jgi:hypothetical protein
MLRWPVGRRRRVGRWWFMGNRLEFAIPNSDELGIVYWWSWRDLNPRPQAFFVRIYMFSVLV